MRSQVKSRCWPIVVMTAMLSLGLVGCEYSKNIQEFPGPWQVLDPGKPLDKFPRIEILEKGQGAIIETGDLVQIGIRNQSLVTGTQYDDGDWWLWIGFRKKKETAFFNYEPTIASALVGTRQGMLLKFLDAKEGIGSGPQYAGKLMTNPFGDTAYYSWRKNTQDFSYLYVPTGSGVSLVTIKRVCKGQARYRTVRLFDDGPVRVHTGGIGSYTSHEPREAWIDEARIEAKCADGKTATFQYGPIDSMNGKEGRSPVRGYFDQWLSDAWQKIPRGVQLK